jgi:hypothetical protein
MRVCGISLERAASFGIVMRGFLQRLRQRAPRPGFVALFRFTPSFRQTFVIAVAITVVSACAAHRRLPLRQAA